VAWSFSSIAAGVKKAVAVVAKAGAAIASNPLVTTVASLVPGGSAAVGILSKAANVTKALVPAATVAKVASPAVAVTPVVVKKNATVAVVAEKVTYKDVTERMRRNGR